VGARVVPPHFLSSRAASVVYFPWQKLERSEEHSQLCDLCGTVPAILFHERE
jgi:hypothetical protein